MQNLILAAPELHRLKINGLDDFVRPITAPDFPLLKLKYIEICADIIDDISPLLQATPNLEVLDLGEGESTRSMNLSPDSLPKLSRLILGISNFFHYDFLNICQAAKNLHTIELYNQDIFSECLIVGDGMLSQLKEICFSETSISEENLSYLIHSLPQLNKLRLSKINGPNLKDLIPSTLPELRQLYSYDYLDFKTLSSIAPKLESYFIVGPGLITEDLKELKASSLKTFNATQLEINLFQFHQIIPAIPLITRIMSLSFTTR
jgi:hypothetical protein